MQYLRTELVTIESEHLPHLSIPQAIGLATWSGGDSVVVMAA